MEKKNHKSDISVEEFTLLEGCGPSERSWWARKPFAERQISTFPMKLVKIGELRSQSERNWTPKWLKSKVVTPNCQMCGSSGTGEENVWTTQFEDSLLPPHPPQSQEASFLLKKYLQITESPHRLVSHPFIHRFPPRKILYCTLTGCSRLARIEAKHDWHTVLF